MIAILYITAQGELAQMSLPYHPDCNLKTMLMSLAQHGLSLEDYTFFRNNLPLKMIDPIERKDRIFAIKEARLPPAVWRADRVIRVNTKI